MVGASVAGCQAEKHTMTESNHGTVIVCQECYDEVQRSWRQIGKPVPGTNQYEYHKHMCASCASEMSIYNENGVTKVKCATCAPEGVPCDKCLPPQNK
jgi:hypothetical protein